MIESADTSSIPSFIEAGKRHIREAANQARIDNEKDKLDEDKVMKNEEKKQ